MAFILRDDIGTLDTPEGLEQLKRKWQQYRESLEAIRGRIPQSAFEFATAPWHYDQGDSRSLHDSWVEALIISEPSDGDRNEIRSLEIQVRLLGPYHDATTTLIYRRARSHSLNTPILFAFPSRDVGHGDWLCDEIRLSPDDHVIHEIEFSRGSRWIIECEDIEWIYTPQQ